MDEQYDKVRCARVWFSLGLIPMETFDAVLTEYEAYLNETQHKFSQSELSPFHPNMRENR